MAPPTPQTFGLHSSIRHGIIPKIKTLLLVIKHINIKNQKGYTPFLLACEQENDEIFDLVFARDDIDITVCTNDGFSALHILAFRNNLRGIEKVLDKFPNVNIDALTLKGDTPLIEACKGNHAGIARFLLEKGANAQHRNYDKYYTPLHYAACYGHMEMVELLLKHGVNLEARDGYDNTPLMKACSWGFVEICRTLINHGANINTDRHNQTPLTSACLYDKSEVTKLLISHGADVNFPGPYSIALIQCVKTGSLRCAKILIEAGANVNAATGKGKTPLDFAIENNQREMVDLLSQYARQKLLPDSGSLL